MFFWSIDASLPFKLRPGCADLTKSILEGHLFSCETPTVLHDSSIQIGCYLDLPVNDPEGPQVGSNRMSSFRAC